MKFVLLLFAATAARASVYPAGEDKAAWDARIDANIDRHRKSDVVVKVSKELRERLTGGSGSLRVQVNMTQQSFPLGTALSTSRISNCWLAGDDDPYCGFARDNFNYGVTENAMKWRDYEPNYGQFNDYEIEQLFNWCTQKGWGMRAHCLFWDVDDYTHYPDWAYPLRGQEMVDAIHHRIETAMPPFAGRVDHWDVNNEMLHGNFFADATGDSGIRAKMFQWVEQQDSSVMRFVNDYNVLLYETDGYINQIQDLLNQGAPVNGIGCQAHLGPDPIDLGKLEDSVNRMSQFGFPIWITEFDWNGSHGNNHDQHAIELDNFYRLLMSMPQVQGILMWGFWDQAHWRPEAAITNGNDCTPNAAGDAYSNLYHNTLQTHDVFEAVDTLSEATHDVYKVRAFRGSYDVRLVDGNGRVLKEVFSAMTVGEDTVLELD